MILVRHQFDSSERNNILNISTKFVRETRRVGVFNFVADIM